MKSVYQERQRMKMTNPMFTNNHSVMMSDGTFKSAKNIQVGDTVMDVNFKPTKVSKIIQGKRGNGNPNLMFVGIK